MALANNSSILEGVGFKHAHDKADSTLRVPRPATATLAEKAAADEAKMPVARLIPSAGVSTPEQTVDRAGFWGNQIKRGGLFVIPLGSPRAQESLKRADTEAIHPEPNEQHVTLRRDAATDLLSAAGVPGALVDSRAEAAGQREAYRRLIHGCVGAAGPRRRKRSRGETGAGLAAQLRRVVCRRSCRTRTRPQADGR